MNDNKTCIFFDFGGVIADSFHKFKHKQNGFLSFLSGLNDIKIVPEINDVIIKLTKSCDLYINTSFNSATTWEQLKKWDLEKLFLDVLGFDISPSKCEKILDVIKEKKYLKMNCFMITDSTEDILESNTAGIRSVGVAWGKDTPENLLKSGAIFIANEPKDLFKISQS